MGKHKVVVDRDGYRSVLMEDGSHFDSTEIREDLYRAIDAIANEMGVTRQTVVEMAFKRLRDSTKTET